MLLGLNSISQTKDEYLRLLAETANSPETLLFLDTNILAYVYKLHEAARREFFNWADAAVAAERLFIPAWSACEYFSRLRDGQLHAYTPRSKDEDVPRKALESMLETASLFVDEKVLEAIGFTGGRTAYLSQFRIAIDGLKKFTGVFKHQFDPNAVHQELQDHLGQVILASDLARLCRKASEEGPSRIEHRLPPGFRDDDKAQNKLGDLIIWFEILEHSRARREKFANVLFLSNDQKSDWVYAPPGRIEIVGGSRKIVPNSEPRIKIADPRLISEFRGEVGHDNFFICELLALVEGFSKTAPKSVGQLAAAIQIELSAEERKEGSAEQPATADEKASVESEGTSSGAAGGSAVRPSAPSSTETVEPVAPMTHEVAEAAALGVEEDGFRDGAYEADFPGVINEIIRDLKSHNWYTQNPAIERIKTIRNETFTSTAWFVLGRNLYQAACGNAQKAMDFMVNIDIQLKRFPPEVAECILAGIIYEIYFDSRGLPRKKAKSGYIEKPLSIVATATYTRVRDFIRAKLAAAKVSLLYTPGDEKKFVLQVIAEMVGGQSEAEKKEVFHLVSVKLDGVELLEKEEEPNRWRAAHLTYTVDDIVQSISESLVIPTWAIVLERKPEVPEDAELVLSEYFIINPRRAFSPGTSA